MIELLRYLESARVHVLHRLRRQSRLHARRHRGPLRDPAERVVGSSNGLRYIEDDHGGTVAYLAEPDIFDDGPVKPVRHLEPHRPAADRGRRELER